MESVLSFLHSVYPLDADLRTYLSSVIKTSRLPKNAILVREGSICRTIGFIEKGIVRGYRTKDNGAETTSFFMQEGDLFISIRSFLTQSPAMDTIKTMEPCIIHTITYDQYRHAHRTYRGFDALRGDLLEKYYLLSEERDEMRQQEDTYIRFCFLKEHYPGLFKRVSDKHLASFIKTTPEYFSTIQDKYRRLNGPK